MKTRCRGALRILKCYTCRLLPESVVWLYANNRVAEAEQIIRNAAKLNNIMMPDKILVRLDTANGDKTDDVDRKKGRKLMEKIRKRSSKSEKKKKDATARYTITDMFRYRRLTVHILCMSFEWSALLDFTSIHITYQRHN